MEVKVENELCLPAVHQYVLSLCHSLSPDHTREKTAVLIPFWTSLTSLQLPPSLSVSFHHSPFSRSLSCFLSLSLYPNYFLPFFNFPPSSPSFSDVSLEFSPLSFIPSFMCLSFPCSLFPRWSNLTSPLPHKL